LVHEVIVKQTPTIKITAQTILFISILAIFILSPSVLMINLFPYSIMAFQDSPPVP